MNILKVNYDASEFNQNERGNHTVSSFNKEIKIQILLEKCIDKEDTKTVTSPSKVEVIEINMPSTQALKNFSLKLMHIKVRLESRENDEG